VNLQSRLQHRLRIEEMSGRSLKLFTLFGFDVRVDASWLIIAALVTWTLAAGYFPYRYPGLPASHYWWMGLVGAALLFGSIIVHELFHSLVARQYGLPMKGITLFVFGGVAEMSDEPPSPKAEFLMAIAGPVASVVIGFVFYVLYHAGAAAWPVQAVGVVAYVYWINWLLAGFNLLPAFPLDGGRVLRSVLWWHWKGDLQRATRTASYIGSGFGVLLMVMGVLQLLFTGKFIGAIWWFVIGMFLRGASQASYQRVLLRRAVEGEPVRRFMKTNPVTVEPNITIQELVDNYIYRHQYKMFPVVEDSRRVLGCVSINEIKDIPREEWAWHHVRELVRPCSSDNSVQPDEDALHAFAKMNRSGIGRVMVIDDGQLVGVVAVKDLLNFLATRIDLEGNGSFRLTNTRTDNDR